MINKRNVGSLYSAKKCKKESKSLERLRDSEVQTQTRVSFPGGYLGGTKYELEAINVSFNGLRHVNPHLCE